MVKDGHFSFQTQLPRLKSNFLQEKKWFVFLQFFIIFSTFFLASWFLFRLDRIFQVHDMTINFSFVLFFFFLFFSICLLRATTHAINGLPSCSISSQCKDYFGRLAFWSKVVYIISVNKKGYGSKVFQRNGEFWSTCPKASIEVISEYHDLRDLCFWVIGRVLAGLKL